MIDALSFIALNTKTYSIATNVHLGLSKQVLTHQVIHHFFMLKVPIRTDLDRMQRKEGTRDILEEDYTFSYNFRSSLAVIPFLSTGFRLEYN